MKDLSLFALDIAQNSVAAGAGRVRLSLTEEDGWLTLVVEDDGMGMSPALLAQAADPFTTTRTTRKVGLGLPLLKEAAELTGGSLELESAPGVGTRVTARFQAGHIDCAPVGDMGSTVSLLMQGNPALTLRYTHSLSGRSFTFSTMELLKILGTELSLAQPEVTLWVRDYIREQEQSLSGGETPATLS